MTVSRRELIPQPRISATEYIPAVPHSGPPAGEDCSAQILGLNALLACSRVPVNGCDPFQVSQISSPALWKRLILQLDDFSSACVGQHCIQGRSAHLHL